MRGLLLVVVALSAGCLRTTQFKCSADEDCSATDGKCEGTSFCSFADTGCSSGRRYGDFAGSLSNQCVGGDGDGGVDVPPGVCPAGYATLPNAGSHKYKVVATVEIWQTQRDRCATDGTNVYLAIPDNMAELQALTTATAAARTWVGIDDLVTEGDYRTVKSTTPSYLPWDTANAEPDNPGPQGGEDCVSALMASPLIATDKCALTEPAVCECE